MDVDRFRFRRGGSNRLRSTPKARKQSDPNTLKLMFGCIGSGLSPSVRAGGRLPGNTGSEQHPHSLAATLVTRLGVQPWVSSASAKHSASTCQRPAGKVEHTAACKLGKQIWECFPDSGVGEVSCNTKRRDVKGWAGRAGYMVNILPDIFERRQCGRPSVTGGAADDADAVVTPNSCEGTLRSLYRCKSERGTEATVEPRCHDVCDQTNFYIGFSHL